MGNTERGHFHETLEAYTAENKYMSDIVKYFVRPSSLRIDVIQLIKGYHIYVLQRLKLEMSIIISRLIICKLC
jgi:hypothetical protein